MSEASREPQPSAWALLLFPPEIVRNENRIKKLSWALLLALLLHVAILLGLLPRIALETRPPDRTEIVAITPQELAEIKNKASNELKDRWTIRPDEQRDQYVTDKPPEDALVVGPRNQKVPKQMFAGPKPIDQPDGSGGAPEKSTSKPAPHSVDLSKLGLGADLGAPKPETGESNPSPRLGPPGPGRPRGIGDKATGTENLLNSVESQFYSFFLRLDEPIAQNWGAYIRSRRIQFEQELRSRKPTPGEQFVGVIRFSIDRGGNFVAIDITRSSGLPSVDWAMRDAVRKLVRVPNPPIELFSQGPIFTRELPYAVTYMPGGPVDIRSPDLYW